MDGAAKHNGLHTCFWTQLPCVWLPAFQKLFQKQIIDVAEVNQRRWLEENGRWLKIVDRVLAGGKIVIQKYVITR